MRPCGRILLLAAASCAPTSGVAATATAANVFAHSETCPIERVSAMEITAPSLRETILSESHPPQEVMDDPERLDMWLANHQRRGRTAGTNLRSFSVEGCDVDAVITCADSWPAGLTRCSTHDWHDHKIDAMVRRADETVARVKLEMCSLPMSWSFGDLCKPRSGP